MPHRVPKTRQSPGSIASLMLAAGLLAGAAHVQAQSGGLHLMPSWYLTPQISAFDPDDGFRVNRHGWGGGLRIGKPVSNDWDVQLLVSHARATDSGNKLNQTLLGGEALFLISRGEFQPFLSLGLGAERDSRSLAGVNTSRTSPYASVGVGARWMFTDTVGLQIDYRRVEGFLRNSQAFGFNRAGNNYWDLGLVWNMGVERPAPKIVQAPPPPVVKPAPPPPPPAPKVEAAPPPPPPPQTITLDAQRLFELNSARIASNIPELDNFATALNANAQITNVVITGHTDQLGTASYNQNLSQKRAEAVKAYLVGKGVDAKRLTARGVASTQLVVNCKEKTRAAMIKCGEPNRRVVVEPITVPKR